MAPRSTDDARSASDSLIERGKMSLARRVPISLGRDTSVRGEMTEYADEVWEWRERTSDDRWSSVSVSEVRELLPV